MESSEDQIHASKKREIAAIFKEYIFQYGMVDTIINDVAKEMHVSKKTIYKYFPGGKQECLYYIFFEIAQEALPETEKSIPLSENFTQQFTHLLHELFKLVVPYVLGNKAQTEEDYLIENQIVGNAFQDAFFPLIRRLLNQGKAAGEFHYTDLFFTFETIAAIMKNSMKFIHRHQGLTPQGQHFDLERETIGLVLKLIK